MCLMQEEEKLFDLLEAKTWLRKKKSFQVMLSMLGRPSKMLFKSVRTMVHSATSYYSSQTD